MKNQKQKNVAEFRAIVIIAFIGAVLLAVSYSHFVQKSFGSTERAILGKFSESNSGSGNKKYTKFPHEKHKQSCDSCHKFPSSNWEAVRAGADAFPDITDYPAHQSCLSCHRQQFFKGAAPAICTICHTNPSPRNSTRHPFQNPREKFDVSPKGRSAVSEFAVAFPHDTHMALLGTVSGDRRKRNDSHSLFVEAAFASAGQESCAVCHQTYQPQGDSDEEYLAPQPKDLGDAFWLKKGTFMTSPIGHASCFSCHSEDIGILPAPSDCAACHNPKAKETYADFDANTAAALSITDKITLLSSKSRHSSATFRHEWFSHAEMDCASCHNVDSMKTLEPATKKVNVMSCSICHITESSDDGGILNFEIDERKKDAKFDCVKCHVAYGKLQIPESHRKAVKAQSGN